MNESTRYPDDRQPPDELNDDVGLAPADAYDPLIEAFKKDVDRTLLRENLKRSVDERARNMLEAIKAADQLRGLAGKRRRHDAGSAS